MPKKTQKPELERLESIENRLLQMEEWFKGFSLVPTSREIWLAYLDPNFAHFYRHFQTMQGKSVPLFWGGSGMRGEPNERPVEPWKHLVRRQHPWRTQLYIKGRNMTARQLVGGVKANQLDKETAAANYEVPVEAVREAIAYVEENKDLLAIEAEIERLMLKQGGVARGPETVPG